MTTEELAKLPILQQINSLSSTIIFFPMIVAALGVLFVPLHLNTVLWACIFYLFTQMSITGGYHRLWAHKCGDSVVAAANAVTFFLLFVLFSFHSHEYIYLPPNTYCCKKYKSV